MTAKIVKPKTAAADSAKPVAEKVKTPPAAVGYLRVSTGEQELEKNKSDILRLANDLNLGRVRFVEEKISGKISWRKRKVADILDAPRQAATALSSTNCRVWAEVCSNAWKYLSVAVQQGVSIYSVKGNWKLDNS